DRGADAKRRAEQEIERAPDHALGRVLHRHDGELYCACFAAAERFVDRRYRKRLDRTAEMLAYRLLAESAFRTEIGDADRLLEAAAGGYDLAEHGAHALRRERPGVHLGDAAQDLGLALGPIGRRTLLQSAESARQRRSPGDQLGQR